MMDVLILELMKGEPINGIQAKQVVIKEFGKIWNEPHPAGPSDSKEVRDAKYHTEIYLAAVKASLLDMENHVGWPMYYGKLRDAGTVRLMLAELKSKALAPSDKVNRTLINYAIIVPAWLQNDMEAIEKSDVQRATDWPGDSYIRQKATMLKAWAKSEFPKE